MPGQIQVSEADARNVATPNVGERRTTSTTAIEFDLSTAVGNGENPFYVRVYVTGALHVISTGTTTGFSMETGVSTEFTELQGLPIRDGGEYSYVYDPNRPFLQVATEAGTGVVYVHVSS